MREIKFRAFDVISKQMWQWGEIFDIPAWEIFPGTPEQRPWEVMQYTGLKDKNGTEIYEGDVIEWNGINYTVCIGEFGVREIETESVTDIVVGVYGDPINETVEPFCFQMQLNANWIARYGITVIGNIYEHPHLLKKGASE